MPAPSEYPDWNLNRAGGSETAPSSVEVNDGYSIADVLRRQHLNWLLGAIGRWVRWLFRALFRSDDLFTSQMVPAHNDPPGTGAGLSAAAADFSARVYVNGHAVGPVNGPARTYTANTDTYWDLTEDGVWTAVEVPASDPAPSVTANSVRCYMLRTNGTDRTTVTSFVDALDALHVAEVMEFDARPILPATGAYFRTTSARDTILQGYDTSGAGFRSIYQVRSGLFGEAAMEIAVNVGWISGISSWAQTDATAPSYLYVFDSLGMHVLWAPAGAGTFPNTVGAGGDWTQVAHVASTISTFTGDIASSGTISAAGNIGGDDITAAGYLQVGDAAPATPPAGRIYTNTIVRAKGTVTTDGGGGVSVVGPVNVSTVTLPSGNNAVRVTFQTALVSTGYQAIAIIQSGSIDYRMTRATKTTTYVDFVAQSGAVEIDPVNNAFSFDFIVIGV